MVATGLADGLKPWGHSVVCSVLLCLIIKPQDCNLGFIMFYIAEDQCWKISVVIYVKETFCLRFWTPFTSFPDFEGGVSNSIETNALVLIFDFNHFRNQNLVLKNLIVFIFCQNTNSQIYLD